MRIGVDARELCGKPTGVGRYLSGLLARWSAPAAAGRHTFLLYAPEAPAAPQAGSSVAVRILPGTGGTWWEQVHLPNAARQDGIDVFFAPAYSAPLRLSVPFVLTVHDLSFVAHPEWFRPRERLRRRWVTSWSARRASVILTDSEFSRGEITARLGVPSARIRVVRPGIPTPGRAGAAAHSAREPMVLFVGSIFNRRRLPDLIGAFARLAAERPDVRLEIVGDDRTYPAQDLASIVADKGLQGRVSIRSYITDEALEDLYCRASSFAFLSEYEGFGLPPLEALASGVPVVMLDTPIARETCGDAALYVARNDSTGTAAALRAVMFDERVRSRVLACAPGVVARYSCDEAARETLAALEDAAGMHRD